MMPLIDLATSSFILFTIIVQEKIKSSKTLARAQSSGVPLEELSCVKLRRLTQEHISKNIPKSSKIHVPCDVQVTHSVNVHVNTKAKGNPMKAEKEGSIIFRFE